MDKNNEFFPARTQNEVAAFLAENPSFLMEFVVTKVPTNIIKSWIRKKKSQLQKDNIASVSDISEMSHSTSRFNISGIHNKDAVPWIFHRLLSVTSTVLDVDTFNLYSVYLGPKTNRVFLFNPENKIKLEDEIKNPNASLASVVGRLKQSIIITDPRTDPLMKKHVLVQKSLLSNNINSVICAPVLLKESHYVVEMGKTTTYGMLNHHDLEFLSVLAAMFGLNLQLLKKHEITQPSKQLHNILIREINENFEHTEELRQMYNTVMVESRVLLEAEKAVIYLMDDNEETVIRCYGEERIESSSSQLKENTFSSKEPLLLVDILTRKPEVTNVTDVALNNFAVYEVDDLIGYKTKNMIAVPIYSQGKVKGLLQYINKIGSAGFSEADEFLMYTLSSYFSICFLYHDVTQDVMKKEQKLTLYSDIYRYYMSAKSEEVKTIQEQYNYLSSKFSENVSDLHWTCDNVTVMAAYYVFMLNLLLNRKIDVNISTNFISVVQKYYGASVFHNFRYAFHCAHCMYCMLTDVKEHFSEVETVSLMISAICHSIDNRGLTNSYISAAHDNLHYLYYDPVLERHYHSTVLDILQNPDNNVLSFLPEESIRQAHSCIKHCLLSKNFAAHFLKRKRLSRNYKLSQLIGEKRKLLLEYLMVASELSIHGRSFAVSEEAAEMMFQEYQALTASYKKKNLPIPTICNQLTLEEKAAKIKALYQHICIPTFRTVSNLVPRASTLLENANQNYREWLERVEDKNSRKWDVFIIEYLTTFVTEEAALKRLSRMKDL